MSDWYGKFKASYSISLQTTRFFLFNSHPTSSNTSYTNSFYHQYKKKTIGCFLINFYFFLYKQTIRKGLLIRRLVTLVVLQPPGNLTTIWQPYNHLATLQPSGNLWDISAGYDPTVSSISKAYLPSFPPFSLSLL